MSFASNTPVANHEGTKPIGHCAVGDQVLAASAAAGGAWHWVQRPIGFSMGSERSGRQQMMIHIVFGDGGRQLIVTPDQLLLIAGGKLVRAQCLVLGVSLVAPDGTALPTHEIAAGAYAGGVHHIAVGPVDAKWDGSLDGHLIACGGAICGDYLLQIHSGDPHMAGHLNEATYPAAASRR